MLLSVFSILKLYYKILLVVKKAKNVLPAPDTTIVTLCVSHCHERKKWNYYIHRNMGVFTKVFSRKTKGDRGEGQKDVCCSLCVNELAQYHVSCCCILLLVVNKYMIICIICLIVWNSYNSLMYAVQSIQKASQ